MATQGARTDDHALIVERYRKLLSELVGNAGSTGARRSDWPDSLLPETRERISAALARTLIDNPDQQTLTRHEALSSLLQRFRPHREVVSEFIATLVTT